MFYLRMSGCLMHLIFFTVAVLHNNILGMLVNIVFSLFWGARSVAYNEDWPTWLKDWIANDKSL